MSTRKPRFVAVETVDANDFNYIASTVRIYKAELLVATFYLPNGAAALAAFSAGVTLRYVKS